MSSWIKCSERMPDLNDGEHIVIYVGYQFLDIVTPVGLQRRIARAKEYCQAIPTHWHPLPEPPKQDQTTEDTLPPSTQNTPS
jgi:hypothetical protein